ncbi:uncharacterized protein LOC119733684 [Patiria miniata]|uniref:Reverse transcriptase domain-containing protein n=1 Tax=Patiria miniata TaxID=46514 RepID=A0A914AH07_PATMI|nr:uncharacterized protein LOC119733684 [Patiria miniata]
MQMEELKLADQNGNYTTTWKIIHTLSGKNSKLKVKVKKRDGSAPASDQELLEEWKDYFSSLLNNPGLSTPQLPPPAAEDLPIFIDPPPPTREETAEAIAAMKVNKAAALDCAITAEALQGGGVIPSMPSVLKSTQPYLHHIKPRLRSNQAGFRSGCSCAQQIHILRRIMEGFKEYQLPLTVTFIDFKKAFDSINRTVMFAVLRHYGIPEPLVNAFQVLYNSSSAVMVDGSISDLFQVSTGVLQGDVLAPFLFIIIVDYLLKAASSTEDSGVVTHPHRSRRHQAKMLNDLDFADIIALLESSTSRAQSQLSRTATAAADLGLTISVTKTEYMSQNLKFTAVPSAM